MSSTVDQADLASKLLDLLVSQSTLMQCLDAVWSGILKSSVVGRLRDVPWDRGRLSW